MRMPWKEKTGIAKAAAILTTILSIATATCGVNALVAISNSRWSHFTGSMGLLLVAGQIELAVIAGSLIGLVVVLVLWIVARLRRKGRNATGGVE